MHEHICGARRRDTAKHRHLLQMKTMRNAAARSSLEETRARLIGTWRLVSWYENGSDGQIVYPLGEDALGQLMYSADGRVSTQLIRADAPAFANDDWRQAQTEERDRAWLDYFGYFGTFSIDDEKNAVIHQVEGSWFPNLNGTRQVRFFRFEGQRLVLDADTAWGKVQIVWEKIPSNV